MKRSLFTAATAATMLVSASTASAQWAQVNRIFLDDVFNADSAYGDNPVSIGFDGSTAYIGGLNNGGNVDSVGIVRVTDLYGAFGSATVTGLADSAFTAVGGRGLQSLAYDAATDSVLGAYDTGGTGSFVNRLDTTGSPIWTTTDPNGRRPFVVGADPLAPNGDPSMAAFLSQGSGRRLALDINDGSLVYSTSDGGIIFDGDLGSAFRGMDFDSEGNLAFATINGVGYYTRAGVNSFSLAEKILTGGANNVGRDVAILEGAGANGEDLLALALRDSTTLDGGSISDANVFITTLDGTIVQTLTGDESGLAAAFANDTKALDFGYAPDGTPTLVIADLVERRLDVYQIPEPTSLALLGLGGLGLLRRRRA